MKSESTGTTNTQRRCPPFPNVPVLVAVAIVVALVLAITVSITMTLAGHPMNLATGIVWG